MVCGRDDPDIWEEERGDCISVWYIGLALCFLRWSSSSLSQFLFDCIVIGDSYECVFEADDSLRVEDGDFAWRYSTHLPLAFFDVFSFGVLELDE